MKKFASVVLALMVVLSMFTFVTSAVNVPEITMTADKTVAEIGDIITVTVATSPKSKLCSFNADMTFSSANFEVVSANVANRTGMSNINYSSDRVRYGLAATTTIADDETTLFTVQLRVKAKDGYISLNVIEAYCDDNGEAVNVTDGVKASIGTIKISVPSSESPVVPDSEICVNGHVWSSWARIKNPTCSAMGEKIRNCTICGAEERGTIDINPTAHKAGAMVTKTPATATKDGLATISCIYCNTVLETEILPMLGDARNPVIPNTDAA